MAKALTIAIDGPAASGKTTLAETLAKKLGLLYFDTGAMYRAVTLAALRRGVEISDEAGLEHVASTIEIELRPPSQADGRLYDVLMDGEDCTWEIRSKEVDASVSQVSAVPGVRRLLSAKQRQIGLQGGVVMVGRDIGTVVLPNADLKIYLDASLPKRGERRYGELVQRGQAPSFVRVLQGLRERDEIDSGRAVAPLRPAADAIQLNTDGMDQDQVFEKVMELMQNSQNVSTSPGVQKPYFVPLKNRIFRVVVAAIVRLLFRILCRIEMVGLEHIPKTGAYIMAYNHISYFEPPLLLAFWPTFPAAVAGADVFDRGPVKLFVRGYGALAVHRGEYDRKIIDEMLWVLASGVPLMIAPEGGRGHAPGLRQARAGVAYLMDRARVPVLPVGVSGTSDGMLKHALRGKRPHLVIKIGEPFNLPPIEGRGGDRRLARQANADLVMRHLAAVLPEDHWGVYKPI